MASFFNTITTSTGVLLGQHDMTFTSVLYTTRTIFVASFSLQIEDSRVLTVLEAGAVWGGLHGRVRRRRLCLLFDDPRSVA